MNKPHVHAELIKAWADGAEIQYLNCFNKWTDCKDNNPEWISTLKYRIKPEPSDLERYGVEVGDIWKAAPDRFVVVTNKIGDGVINVTGSFVVYAALGELLFRRGEVNKL